MCKIVCIIYSNVGRLLSKNRFFFSGAVILNRIKAVFLLLFSKIFVLLLSVLRALPESSKAFYGTVLLNLKTRSNFQSQMRLECISNVFILRPFMYFLEKVALIVRQRSM